MAKAPGVYQSVVDKSTYRRASGDMKIGIVGTADWGPVNTPTLCASPGDLKTKFTGSYQGIYAAENDLMFTPNVYFNRIIHAIDGVKATVEMVVASTDIITATALYYGTRGNDISLQIKPSSNLNTACFDLHVKLNDVTVKVHTNVSETTYLTLVSDWVVLTASSGTPHWPDWTTADDEEFDLIGGDSGESVVSADIVGVKGVTGVSDDTGIYVFARRNWRMLDVVLIPGYSEEAVVLALQTLIDFYHNKQVMGMVDIPAGSNRTQAMDWINSTGSTTPKLSQPLNNYALFSSYPWHNQLTSAGVEYAVAPSAVASAVWASSIRVAIYKAPAGPKRGKWAYSTSLEYDFELSDIAVMYGEDGQCINVFYNDPEKGILLKGQKTTYRANSDLNRVKTVFNLNRMLKELDYSVSDETFEDNNAGLWSILDSRAETVLSGRKAAGLLWNYEFICNLDLNSDDNGRIYTTCYAQVRVQFTPTAEWIDVEWSLSPAGTDFNVN